MEASKYSETIQVVSQETSEVVWSEIGRRLTSIAETLGVSPEELAIYNFGVLPSEFMETEERDPICHSMGPVENLPFVKHQRLNGPHRSIGWGITVYKNRRSEDLKYAIYTAAGQWGDKKYLIIEEAKTFQLLYNARAANKAANKITKPPILDNGLLDKIVQNTVGFLQKSRVIEKYGVRIKRGIILEGQPGNGKTMACRYIQKLCSQNGYDWGIITSSDIDGAYEDGELNHLFQRYTVSFFDDIDVQYLDRSKGNGKIACSLLTAMDGMSEKGHLVRVFTTNERVTELDHAFTRPGRIDKMITLKTPTEDLRRRLVEERWPSEIRTNIDVDNLILNSNDFSFAEVEAIRTFLVTEKVLGSGKWDLEKAFQEFSERQKEKGNCGFNK